MDTVQILQEELLERAAEVYYPRLALPRPLPVPVELYGWQRMGLMPLYRPHHVGKTTLYVALSIVPGAAPGLPSRATTLYVGQTNRMFRRLDEHEKKVEEGERAPATHIAWGSVEPGWADVTEIALIRRLLPLYNERGMNGDDWQLGPEHQEALRRLGMEG